MENMATIYAQKTKYMPANNLAHRNIPFTCLFRAP